MHSFYEFFNEEYFEVYFEHDKGDDYDGDYHDYAAIVGIFDKNGKWVSRIDHEDLYEHCESLAQLYLTNSLDEHYDEE